MRLINKDGLELIKSFEGLRLRAYKDSVGVLTIGYGHTKGVRKGQSITEAQAEQFLRDDLFQAERAVSNVVKAPITDNQFAALVSFTFNLGPANLMKLVSKGLARAPSRLLLFDYAKGKKLPGLTRRRKAELELYLKP